MNNPPFSQKPLLAKWSSPKLASKEHRLNVDIDHLTRFLSRISLSPYFTLCCVRIPKQLLRSLFLAGDALWSMDCSCTCLCVRYTGIQPILKCKSIIIPSGEWARVPLCDFSFHWLPLNLHTQLIRQCYYVLGNHKSCVFFRVVPH